MAEKLLDQAELLSVELDMSWPELRARHDALLARADCHARLAQSAPGYGFHRSTARTEAPTAQTIAANEAAPVPIRTEYGTVLVDNAATKEQSP